jgi:subtilisin
VLTKCKSLKAAIVVGAIILGLTSAAGASTGALPGPVQQVAHEMLDAVGVTVPGDKDVSGQGAAEVAEAGQGAGSSKGRSTASPDTSGLTRQGTTTSTAPAATNSGQGVAGAAAANGRYIVVLKDSVANPAMVARSQTTRHQAELGFVYHAAIKGYSATLSTSAVRDLRRDPLVAAVVEDREVRVAAQRLPTGIDRIDGELSSTASGDGIGSVDADIAVLDTGIDTGHPDLNVVGGVACNGSGYQDRNGHGTHVAGIAAARDNSDGVVGVAPGARLWAVRVLNSSGKGSWSNLICGVDWVTRNAATIEVANVSLGGSGSEPAASGCSTGDPMHDAICRSVQAGVTYAVAAGNSATNASNLVPAAYDEVITVSALADFNGQPGGGAAPTCRADSDDTLADSSNFGSDIDLIAPGTCISSTYRGGRYATMSGTSMAAPHVAGAAALYRSANPVAYPAEVKTALQTASQPDPQSPGNAVWNGVGDPDGIHEQLLNVDVL